MSNTGSGLVAPNIVAAGGTTETVTGILIQDAGIDPASVTADDLTVTGPDGTPLQVTGVTANPNGGLPFEIEASYTVAAPAGGWKASDNGTYAVSLKAGAVTGRAGPLPGAETTFQVAIGPTGTLGLSLLRPTARPPEPASLGRVAVPTSLSILLNGVFGNSPLLQGRGAPRAMAKLQVSNAAAGAVAGRTSITVFASTTPSAAGAIVLGKAAPPLRLGPGRARQVAVPISGTSKLPPGNYYLVARLTAPDGSVTQTSSPYPVYDIAAPDPEAVISGVLEPIAPVRAGTRVTASVLVDDRGNVPVAGTSRLSLSASVQPSAPGTVVYSAPLKVRLKPGGSKTYRLKFTLPASLGPGSYYLTATLDAAALGDTNPTHGLLVSDDPFTVT